MVRAYIGLGSNLEDPIAQVQRALHALTQLPDCRFGGHSSLYRSAPLGPQDQPDYINAVAALDTALPPRELLRQLHALERAQGRTRVLHWGPRCIDLDLLLYGERVLNEPDLVLPHPGVYDRNFVLAPLHELAGDLSLPDGTRVLARWSDCAPLPLTRLPAASARPGAAITAT